MRNILADGILQRILVIVVITILLGFSPLPHVVESGLTIAGRAQTSDRPESAAANLALVAEHLPWRSELWEQAGLYALMGHKTQDAVSYFKEAAAIGVLSQDGYLQMGDAYLQLGNPYTAVQIWETAIYIYGPSESSLTRLANTQRDVRDYPALIKSLKTILTLSSQDTPQNGSRAGLYYELGMLLAAHDPAAAPPYLLQAVELDPKLTDASELAFTIQRALPKDNTSYTLMAAGRKLASLMRWELAAYAFQRVINAQPEYGEAWAYLGEVLQHVESPASGEIAPMTAYQALEKSLEINPDSLPANTFMALYWRRNDDPERSYEYLSQAARIDPKNPDIQVDLGSVIAILGDLETAAENYWNAIEITARDPVYLREYVKFLLRYNIDLEKVALPIAREILISHPDDPASLDLMAQILFRFGDLLNAERFLLRAIQLDPNWAPAHLHLGLVYAMQEKSSQADDEFAKAISSSPGSPTAYLAERYLGDPALP